jgi:hypothetical protein
MTLGVALLAACSRNDSLPGPLVSALGTPGLGLAGGAPLQASADLCATVVCAPSDACHVAGVCNPADGTCSDPVAPDGTACSDANACTQTDTCQAGTCTGANPVVCTASDQCHVAGVCNPVSGACSNPEKADFTACNDGNACTQTDVCQAGTCTGANPVVCTASDQCHVAGVCNPVFGACSNPEKADFTACNDGNACTQTDVCQAGTCTGANPVVCTASDQCHDAGVCSPATGTCSNPNAVNGRACNDGNACTQTDVCQAGACTGANPVVCTASDQCHDVGVCSPATGTCSNPNAVNGRACNDANACTQTDTCQAGACTGANPVVCTASDQCHDVGVCSPATGACSSPAAPDGRSCNDANACTQDDTCQAGACTGANPVVCAASDPCHDAGVCSPATGTCSNPNGPDGRPCNDANACTQTDTCQAGACTGGNPVVCAPQGPCYADGTCNPASGACTTVFKDAGTACDDGNACTQTDTCSGGGLCFGTNPVICGALDACHAAGVCDAATGSCSNPAGNEGASCDDGNTCTRADACAAGACTGTTYTCDDGLACTWEACDGAGGCTSGLLAGACLIDGACYAAGAPRPSAACELCDPARSTSAWSVAFDGTACGNGDACDGDETCSGGACVPGTPVVCQPQDACHVATCDAATGACGNALAADGTACDDARACTTGDRCVAGLCTPLDASACECTVAADCPPAPPCRQVACDSPSESCVYTDAADGSACDDANACTGGESCQAGVCGSPTDSVTCEPTDACHVVGVCDTATGACTQPLASDGTPCPGGACAGGVCVPETGGGEPPGGCGCGGSASPGALLLLLLGLAARRRRPGEAHRG